MFSGRQRAAIFAAAVNIILFFGKLLGGFFGRSSGLLADALDSMTDFLGDVVVLGGVSLAKKPPDEKHQYGHYKAESLVTAIVGLMIIAGAVVMLARGVFSFGRPATAPELWTAIIAAGSVIICIGTYLYLHNRAGKLSSPALDAGAAHKLADAFTSIAALTGILLSSVFHIRWGDSAASALVAIWVIRTGIVIVSRGGHELLDGAPSSEIENLAIKIIAETPGVINIGDVRMRSAGGRIFAEIDISTSKDLSVADGHIVAHRVRNRLKRNLKNLADAVIHIEPCYKDASQKDEIKKAAQKILAEETQLRGFHGINVLPSNVGFILVADIVVSPSITVKEAHDIAENLRQKLIQIPQLGDAILHIDYKRD